MRNITGRSAGRLAVVAALGSLALAGCSTGSGPTATTDGGAAAGGAAGSASCAAAVRYDGHLYLGRGELKRTPETTGRTVDGVIPACNDTSDANGTDEAVRLAELADVPLDTAVLMNAAVFVREGRELPAAASDWFTPPGCTSTEEFDIVGDWLGVEGPKPVRFDGDIRPPYRLSVRVTDGPEEYVGTTIEVHADAATDPQLGPEDVKSSLWEGGQVAGHIRCVNERFEATSLRVPTD